MSKTTATTTASFAYESTSYTIELCDQHAAMFDRDLLVWARLAEEVGSAWAKQASSLAEVTRPAPPKPKPPEFTPASTPHRNGFSDRTLGFGFTYHASERMKERQISPNDVYALIESPAIRRIGSTPGTHVYLNEAMAVVVNEDTATIITVANRSERIEENGNQN